MKTRLYEGNDKKFVEVFADPRYATWINNTPQLQTYWSEPMYCLKRKPDGYIQVVSNIHLGDFFGCGKTSQVGLIYSKILHIQCSMPPEKQKPSPDGQGGNYISYSISGDIGGHWYSPLHDDFIKTGHFLWLPTPERLAFAGFFTEGQELHLLMRDIIRDMLG